MTQLFDTRPAGIVGYAHVALEQGIDVGGAGLTYAVPEALADLAVGERVMVPLGRGNKLVPGHIIERVATTDLPGVKPIAARDKHGVSLTTDLVDLARWMAAYYCCPLGMVLVTMLPAAVKKGVGAVRQLMVSAKPPEGAEAVAGAKPQAGKLSKAQQAVLEVAQQRAATAEPWVEIKELADLAGVKTVGPVKQLIEKGLLVAQHQPAVRALTEIAGLDADPTPRDLALTDAQQRALRRLADSVHAGFGVHLLHGVTGSGKTEVYLRLIEEVAKWPSGQVAQSSPHSATPPRRGAIVLVPEIALTPQIVRRFVGRFPPGSVAVLHSGLTAAQRHDQWRRIRSGEAYIVVGARSAIFAPLPGVGVIIVDEEHDASYKQDQLPRYHARDLAIKRGQVLGIPVVLGSATPSLESYYNATVKRSYHLLQLPARVAGLKLPTVQLVDMREERRKRYQATGKGGVHLLSMALEMRLQQTLDAGGQAILLLNRRGYANYIACPDHGCGWMLQCNDCDATMVFHKSQQVPAGGFVRCHHCQAEQQLPPVCPTCGKKVTVFGLGTQRVEEELGKKFPGVTMLRMDSDTMQGARDYMESLRAFGEGRVRVLLGTQMIAKGLDFPNVRLVGVISADTALNMPDFRATERTFQLIAQVSGRAGRGDAATPGYVVVQTFNPEDPAIVLASKHDYEGFAARELETRRAAGLPPFSRMARIVVRDQDHVACHEQVKKLADLLNAANAELGNVVRVRGPMVCPIGRIAGFHREQVELIAPDAGTLQKLMTALRNAKALRADRHTAVDVDPVDLL